MTSHDPEQHRRDQAWQALGTAQHHPQVRHWLKAADQQFALQQAFAEDTTRRRQHRLYATVASIVVVVLGILGYWHFSQQYYETHVGEQRDVLLADGSRITLNTNTAVSVHYSKTRRYILLKRGEALFSVAHNAARPFEVMAAGMVTRALGTEFNVDVRSAKVTVSVLDGAVQVSANDFRERSPIADDTTAAARVTALAKGQALEFWPRTHQLIHEKADLARIDAWRTRRLEFSNLPLAEALAEINRYSARQLVIGTPGLAERRISGIFHIGDLDGFLYSLHESLGIEAHESTNSVVLMQTDNPDQQIARN